MTHLTESGEPMTVEECRRCGAQPAKGISFIRASVHIFKCDDCGKSMHLDYLEDAHKKQMEGKLAHEKATENRDRFWRENQQMQEEQFKKRQNEPDANPEAVFNIDYINRKL